jgi:HicA toxin of bacterial toxin-antitoxin,
MNSRQRKTLALVFAEPVPRTLPWSDIESMLLAAGAMCLNKGGSAVTFTLGGERLDVHRPHPRKEAKPYVVRNARRFLELAGVRP